jgi:hypothetical protein
MTEPSRLDLMLNRAFEEDERKRVEEEARVEALRDPFKKANAEPGRARRRRSERKPTSLGDEHS